MKPTLVVLAAGMGSRYGKLKQMDAFGPNGETIIDYSIYDAIEAGFGKVVFIVRDFFKDEFKEMFDKKFGDRVELVYVTQDLNKIPEGFDINPDREKPWGTAHAVAVAEDVVNEPFAVINADDFYGKSAYKVLADYFNNDDSSEDYAVVGYKLKNTLSDHGTVNRGVCYQDADGNLEKVVECIKIRRGDDGRITYPEKDAEKELGEDTLVSMNMWAFRPSYFEYFHEGFSNFLNESGSELKSEYFIPLLVDNLITSGALNVKVLDTDADWFGVTYIDDKPIVQQKLQALIDQGAYPEHLY